VRVVHSLEGDAGIIAVEIAILDQVLDRVDRLTLLAEVCRACHDVCCTFLRVSACVRRASNTA
jgi:hypothetical protein